MPSAKPTFYQYWARCLVKNYPATWRERYTDEMLLVLEDAQPTLKTILNLSISLLDAYLHRDLVQERMPSMLQKIRSNELAIYGATLIFFFAWFVAQLHIVVPNQPKTLTSSFVHTTSWPVNIIHSISYILLLFILLGGLPILLATCWKAVQTRNIRVLLLCILGVFSPLVAAFLSLLSLDVWERTLLHGSLAVSLALCIFFVGLNVSLALLFSAVQRVAPSRRITYYVLWLARLVPFIMFTGLATLLFELLPSFTDIPMAGDTIFYMLRQVLLILVMIATLAFAVISLKKGLQARQAIQIEATMRQ